MPMYDQEKPPEDPLDARNTWLKPGSFGERVWWFALIATVAFIVVMIVALIVQKVDDADAASACFKTTGTGAVEDNVGTDLVRGHTTGFWCDKGAYLSLGGVRTRAETTNWGEIAQWSGRDIAKGLSCAVGTNNNCRFGVWWGKFKAVQRLGPLGGIVNTEYLRVRVRCNYQRECRQAHRHWGRAPYPMSEPSESTDVWTGGTHSMVWNTTLPIR